MSADQDNEGNDNEETGDLTLRRISNKTFKPKLENIINMVMEHCSTTSKKISGIFKISFWIPLELGRKFVVIFSWTFIEDAEVENNILKPNLVLSNIAAPARLDEFLREVLEEKNKHFQIQ